jgi:fructokinase
MTDLRHVVLLFGEILIDRFPDREVLGGAPLSAARHLHSFGCRPVLISRIGQDAAGARLLQTLRGSGLTTHGVQLDSVYHTGIVEVKFTAAGHRFDILPDQAYDHIHPRLSRITALAANPEWIYFGSLAQRGSSHRALRHTLRAVGGRRFFDVNLRDPWVSPDRIRWSLQHADVVKANDAELARIAQLFGVEERSAETQALRLVRQYQLRGILITCGAAGAWWLDESGQPVTVASESVENILDTVGAGDAFSAVFILGQLRGWDLTVTLQRAHRFAGAICQIRGAIPDNDDFYKPFTEEWFSPK